ncbi:hypothetical protein PROFUN_06345 [Planoprotostelium fungivorum]|uniref:Uncharacterized protein n=1 Tax=Planoprotostelium fungivorum TaxID=1890364 RepID=A0A2P6NP68_9EUKA|nr:hypothetical protein PROFUN_06345 [Planoprotostelium fungivorum]
MSLDEDSGMKGAYSSFLTKRTSSPSKESSSSYSIHPLHSLKAKKARENLQKKLTGLNSSSVIPPPLLASTRSLPSKTQMKMNASIKPKVVVHPFSAAVRQHPNLVEYQKINLAEKGITDSHSQITTLFLSGNDIKDLGGLIQFPKLKVLSLAHNQIPDVEQLERLRDHCHHIVALNLEGNPITMDTNYRSHALVLFPKLKLLDNKVSSRITAARAHGADQDVTASEKKTAEAIVKKEETLLNLMYNNECLIQKLQKGVERFELYRNSNHRGRDGELDGDEDSFRLSEMEASMREDWKYTALTDVKEYIKTQSEKKVIMDDIKKRIRMAHDNRMSSRSLTGNRASRTPGSIEAWDAAFSEVILLQQDAIATLLHEVETIRRNAEEDTRDADREQEGQRIEREKLIRDFTRNIKDLLHSVGANSSQISDREKRIHQLQDQIRMIHSPVKTQHRRGIDTTGRTEEMNRMKSSLSHQGDTHSPKSMSGRSRTPPLGRKLMMDDIEEQVQLLERELEEKSQQNRQLQEHLELFQRQNEENANKAESEILQIHDQFNEEKRQLLDKIKRLESENSRRGNTNEKKLRDMEERHSEELDKLRSDVEDVHAENQVLREELSSNQKDKATIESLRHELEEADREIQDVREELSSSQRQVEKLKRKLEDAVEETEKAHQDAMTPIKKLSEQKSRRKMAENQTSELKDQLSSLKDQLREAKDSLRRSEEEKRSQDEKIKNTEEKLRELNDAKSQIEFLKKQMSEIKSKDTVEVLESGQVTLELERTRLKLEEMKKMLAKKENELIECKMQLEENKEQLSEIDAVRTKMRDYEEKMSDYYDKLIDENHSLQLEIEDARRQLVNTTSAVEKSRGKFEGSEPPRKMEERDKWRQKNRLEVIASRLQEKTNGRRMRKCLMEWREAIVQQKNDRWDNEYEMRKRRRDRIMRKIMLTWYKYSQAEKKRKLKEHMQTWMEKVEYKRMAARDYELAQRRDVDNTKRRAFKRWKKREEEGKRMEIERLKEDIRAREEEMKAQREKEEVAKMAESNREKNRKLEERMSSEKKRENIGQLLTRRRTKEETRYYFTRWRQTLTSCRTLSHVSQLEEELDKEREDRHKLDRHNNSYKRKNEDLKRNLEEKTEELMRLAEILDERREEKRREKERHQMELQKLMEQSSERTEKLMREKEDHLAATRRNYHSELQKQQSLIQSIQIDAREKQKIIDEYERKNNEQQMKAQTTHDETLRLRELMSGSEERHKMLMESKERENGKIKERLMKAEQSLMETRRHLDETRTNAREYIQTLEDKDEMVGQLAHEVKLMNEREQRRTEDFIRDIGSLRSSSSSVRDVMPKDQLPREMKEFRENREARDRETREEIESLFKDLRESKEGVLLDSRDGNKRPIPSHSNGNGMIEIETNGLKRREPTASDRTQPSRGIYQEIEVLQSKIMAKLQQSK